MSRKRFIRWGAVLVGLAAVGTGIFFAVGQLSGSSIGRESTVPTARVQRGNVDLKVYTTGELRAAQNAMLVAPPVRGSLQVVYLAKTGTRVKPGDLVLEFDPTEQEYNLEQSRSDLMQAEQEILKSEADAAVQRAQDQVTLLSARFAVRRAELEVSRNELLSTIDAQKNNLNLEEARRRFTQLEQDMKSREASAQAGLEVLKERRNKAMIDMKVAEDAIKNMKLTAPIAGLVAVKENPDATGMGWISPGMVVPEYREGDSVFPGRFIAEVLADENLEILGKVSENDRANLNPGQTVEVVMDSLPGRKLGGQIKTVAGMAARNFWGGGGAVRQFDATFEIKKDSAMDALLRPGSTAQVVIVGEQVKDVLWLPRQAIFEKDSKPVVYLRKGNAFEPREVKIIRRTESQVIIEGVAQDAEVALVNPDQRGNRPAKTAPSGPSLGGGSR